ncbi:MAG: hypothetical protein HFH87_07265 [Lachnospiraceae bacterium]|nr:hypothetical protein [Lachnospiraceae bacterium]
MSKSILKMTGKSILLLLAGIICGTAILTLAYLLPVNPRNRDMAYAQLDSEGWYPRASISSASLDTWFHSHFPDVLDGNSDKIMLYTALDDTPGNPLMRAMNSYSQYRGYYTYYWHGYVSILRPLLYFFDLAEFRGLNMACQLLLMTVLAIVIGREKGLRYACMFATSCILLMPLAVSMSLQFSWVFYIGLTGTLVLLSWKKYFSENLRYVYFFLALGMLTSYFDLLTYPLFTWGIPLIWWIVTEKENKKAAHWLKMVVNSGVSWIAGYGIFWFSKWILAGIVTGRDVLGEAVNEVFLRSGTLEGQESGFSGRFTAIYTNWLHYEYKIYALLLAGWLVWWLYHSVKQGGWLRSPKKYAYLLTGLAGFVWYFVLSNHTAGHHFFTYRIFSVTILAFLAVILEGISAERCREKVPWKRKIMTLVLAGGVLLPAAFLARLAREELRITNGGEAYRQIPMEQNQLLEAVFVPSLDRIKGIGLGLQCEDTEGEYVITLWDGDALEYQITIPIAEGEGENYLFETTDWELEHGKEYRLTVEARGNREPVYVWVTENGAMPLAEYGKLSINGEETEGQLLTGINYWGRPISEKRLLFLTLSWFGLLMAVCSAVLFEKKEEWGTACDVI